jgi:hypothetical protein
VSARIYLKGVRDSAGIKDLVQFFGAGPETVLIADINRDRTILAEIADVLVYENQRCVCDPPVQYVLLWNALLRR